MSKIYQTRNGGIAITSEPKTTPSHPLIIDATTKLARPITDEDVRIMEAKCHAYDAMIEEMRNKVRLADYFTASLAKTYGKHSEAPGCKGSSVCKGTPPGWGCTCIG